MSDLLGRSFRLAKTYLDDAKGRIEELSEAAQEELTHALSRDDIQAGLSASDDPMERAQAKIAAARGAGAAQRELSPGRYVPDPPPASATPTDPMQTAYKILGVSSGADFLTVQAAANKLRERCDPSRFPEGAPERAEAQRILQKAEEAYQLLQNALDPGAGRFDKLEI